MKFEYPAGATPIDPDEAAGLIPAHVTWGRITDTVLLTKLTVDWWCVML